MRVLGWSVMCGVALLGCAKQGFENTVAKQGFTTVSSPTVRTPVGSVVARTSDAPPILEVLCTAEQALGDLSLVSERPAPDVADGAAYDLDTTVLESDDRFAAVKGVTASLSRPVVRAVVMKKAPEAVSDNRTDGCEARIAAQEEAENAISMVIAALQADVIYEVTFTDDEGRDAAATEALVQELAAAMQIAGARVEGTTVTSRGVFLGLKGDPALATYGMPGDRGIVDNAMPPEGASVVVQDPEPAAPQPPARDPRERDADGQPDPQPGTTQPTQPPQ